MNLSEDLKKSLVVQNVKSNVQKVRCHSKNRLKPVIFNINHIIIHIQAISTNHLQI